MTEHVLFDHLSEFRKRLIQSLLFVSLVFAVLFIFTDQVFSVLAKPLLQELATGEQLIATDVTAPVFMPLKLDLVVAIFISIPFLLFQLWSFIAPALYKTERKFAVFIVFTSTLLFYLGASFAYFAVFPLIFKFFANMTPTGVAFMPDINQYLDFCLKMFLAFGIAFEVPVLTVLLVKSGATSIEKLKSWRPYIIVGAFIIGMFLTPPDVLSQVLLAVPICILFEVGLILAKIYK